MKKTKVIRRIVVAGVLSASIVTSFQLYSQHQEDQHSIQVLQGNYKELQSVKNALSDEVSVLHDENQSLKVNLHEANNASTLLQQEVDGLQSKNKELSNANQSLKAKVEKLESSQKQVLPSSNSVASDGTWSTYVATYYDANEPSTGKRPGHPDYGKTASGKYVKEGVTLAVDRNVIPLGTWVLLKYPDGRIEKRQAQDTGGAIKGRKVDIYIPHATLSSGKHEVQIKILGKE